MERYLEGQGAIVTGGMRGIGFGIARKLHDRGAQIAIWDANIDGWDKGKHGLWPALIQRVDVSSRAAVEDAFAETLRALDQVHILVNNAGINGPIAPSWEYPPEMWSKVIAVDLTSVFYCCRVAIPHMLQRKYGRVHQHRVNRR